jgi:deoxycytidylate deaminase
MNKKWIIDFIHNQITEKQNKEKYHYAYFLHSKCKIAEGTNNFIENKTCTTIHAEMNALAKIQKWKVCPTNIDLIVIKIKKNGDIGNAKPCNHCIQILSQSKIKINNVYYSTTNINTNINIIKEKFSKMKIFNINNIDKKIMSKSLRYKCGDREFNI